MTDPARNYPENTRVRVTSETLGGIDYVEVGDLSLLKALERLPRAIERRSEE